MAILSIFISFSILHKNGFYGFCFFHIQSFISLSIFYKNRMLFHLFLQEFLKIC